MPIDDRAIRKRVQGFIATGAGQGDLWLARTPSAGSDVMAALAAR
jgi:hypothetical protein